MKTAVIVTTYNRPDALAAVLDGYLAQDTHGFDLVIADDGSTDDTRALIADYARRSPFMLRHVWQEDRGFRAATIRNRALAATEADYVILSDGDCVPQRDFVSRHCQLAEPGYFLSGNRILLSGAFTAKILQQHPPLYDWGVARWLVAWLRRDINRWLPMIKFPDGAFRKRTPDRWKGVKTCNLSAWRADLIAVNGFDEAYAGKWGLEDSDLVIRLLHAGIRYKSARFAAPVFHLWHKEIDRSGFAENQRLLDALIASRHTYAKLGVDQYS